LIDAAANFATCAVARGFPPLRAHNGNAERGRSCPCAA
jgi:hypothetical protein